MRKQIEVKYREFVRLSWLLLIGGFILFSLGATKFLFFSPGVGINLKTQQPVVLNGSLIIILGLVFFLAGIYRIRHKNRAFQNELKVEKEIKEIEEKQRKKTMGY